MASWLILQLVIKHMCMHRGCVTITNLFLKNNDKKTHSIILYLYFVLMHYFEFLALLSLLFVRIRSDFISCSFIYSNFLTNNAKHWSIFLLSERYGWEEV